MSYHVPSVQMPAPASCSLVGKEPVGHVRSARRRPATAGTSLEMGLPRISRVQMSLTILPVQTLNLALASGREGYATTIRRADTSTCNLDQGRRDMADKVSAEVSMKEETLAFRSDLAFPMETTWPCPQGRHGSPRGEDHSQPRVEILRTTSQQTLSEVFSQHRAPPLRQTTELRSYLTSSA